MIFLTCLWRWNAAGLRCLVRWGQRPPSCSTGPPIPDCSDTCVLDPQLSGRRLLRVRWPGRPPRTRTRAAGCKHGQLWSSPDGIQCPQRSSPAQIWWGLFSYSLNTESKAYTFYYTWSLLQRDAATISFKGTFPEQDLDQVDWRGIRNWWLSSVVIDLPTRQINTFY